jgi:hypothetical protein
VLKIGIFADSVVKVLLSTGVVDCEGVQSFGSRKSEICCCCENAVVFLSA